MTVSSLQTHLFADYGDGDDDASNAPDDFLNDSHLDGTLITTSWPTTMTMCLLQLPIKTGSYLDISRNIYQKGGAELALGTPF